MSTTPPLIQLLELIKQGGGSPISSGAMILLEAHTAVNSTELDFTSSITSAYDDYIIEFINIVPASASQSLLLQVSTNGGVTYDNSPNYGWAGYRASAVGSAFAGFNTTNGINLDAAGTVTPTASHGGLCGTCRMFNPLSGTAYTRFKVETGTDDGSSNFCIAVMVAGAYAVTTAVNAFRIIATSGNLTSGTVRVYGLVK